MSKVVSTIPSQTLHDIVAVLDAGITASSIASPVSASALQSDRKVREVRDYMTMFAFDRLAVAQSDQITGYVDLVNLNKAVSDDLVGLHARPFEPELLVSDATPLPFVLQRMQEQSAVFVVGSNGVSGIITHSDLEKQCMRVYLFGLVSLFEQELCTWMKDLSYDEVLAAIYNTAALEPFTRGCPHRRHASSRVSGPSLPTQPSCHGLSSPCVSQCAGDILCDRPARLALAAGGGTMRA